MHALAPDAAVAPRERLRSLQSASQCSSAAPHENARRLLSSQRRNVLDLKVRCRPTSRCPGGGAHADQGLFEDKFPGLRRDELFEHGLYKGLSLAARPAARRQTAITSSCAGSTRRRSARKSTTTVGLLQALGAHLGQSVVRASASRRWGRRLGSRRRGGRRLLAVRSDGGV